MPPKQNGRVYPDTAVLLPPLPHHYSSGLPTPSAPPFLTRWFGIGVWHGRSYKQGAGRVRIQRVTYFLGGQAIALHVTGGSLQTGLYYLLGDHPSVSSGQAWAVPIRW